MTAGRPVLPMCGGCSCGALRYEITSFPLLLYTCNCADCQTASGSAFALNMPVTTDGFRLLRGAPKGWRHPSPSGADVTSWFCGDCGARLYGERAGRPESMNLRAGTLDDTVWLKPVAHMFVASAQGWLSLPDGAECHQMSPPDFRRLAGVWQAMWPEFYLPNRSGIG